MMLLRRCGFLSHLPGLTWNVILDACIPKLHKVGKIFILISDCLDLSTCLVAEQHDHFAREKLLDTRL